MLFPAIDPNAASVDSEAEIVDDEEGDQDTDEASLMQPAQYSDAPCLFCGNSTNGPSLRRPVPV